MQHILRPLYAQSCPQQPEIRTPNKHRIYQSTNKKDSEQSTGLHLHNDLYFGPKILHTHQKIQSYQEIEHQRQLKSLWSRIKNCKSFQQRKKDRTDPLTYPVCFIRQQSNPQQLNMNKYYRKTVGKSKQKKKKYRSNNGIRRHMQDNEESFKKFDITDENIHNNYPYNITQNQLPSPMFLKKPQISEQIKYPKKNYQQGVTSVPPLNLPICSQQDIIRHIIDHNIHKASDRKILFSRLAHEYGQKRVLFIWQKVIYWLDGDTKQSKKRKQ